MLPAKNFQNQGESKTLEIIIDSQRLNYNGFPSRP